MQKKEESKERNNMREQRKISIIEGLTCWISTEEKSTHLIVGSMSTQGNDAQCQSCGVGAKWHTGKKEG